MKKTNKKGFTIVELVIVIAVIAILAGVLIPTFSNVVKKANESKALQAARNEFTEAYALAIADDGKISADDEGVAVSSENLTITTTNFVFTINKTTYDIISVAGSTNTAYTDYITYVSGKMAGV